MIINLSISTDEQEVFDERVTLEEAIDVLSHVKDVSVYAGISFEDEEKDIVIARIEEKGSEKEILCRLIDFDEEAELDSILSESGGIEGMIRGYDRDVEKDYYNSLT